MVDQSVEMMAVRWAASMDYWSAEMKVELKVVKMAEMTVGLTAALTVERLG